LLIAYAKQKTGFKGVIIEIAYITSGCIASS
jgi:hypothetical protein